MEDQTKYPGKSGLDLVNTLRMNCDQVVEEQFAEPVKDEELQELKNEMVDISIEVRRLEDEKKEYVKSIKEEMKPMLERQSEIIGIVTHKQRIKHGELFKFVEGHKAMFYNEKGQLIYSRPIREDEKQLTLPGSSRAVNQ